MKKYLGALIVSGLIGCSGPPAFERIAEARRISAELLQQLITSTAATNRAVMAGGKPESAVAATQAEAAADAVAKSAGALKPILEGLRYAEELRLLDEFQQQFESYRTAEKQIHGFLIESSNVTAQQMAFGPGSEAADAVERQVQAAAGRAPAPAMWQARALANSVSAAVRQIQVLQARHIPENDDAVMDGIERQMAAVEKTARESGRGLSAIVPASSGAGANVALDRFMSVNTDILRLSRRNTNVHALALALGTQGVLTARCEEILRKLQTALNQRGFTGTR